MTLSLLLAFAKASGGEGGGGVLTVDGGLGFWTVVMFVLLLVVLGKFAWKPIISALDEREKKINDSLQAAEKAKDEAKKISEENKVIIAKAQEEAQQIIAQSRKFAEDLRAENKQKADIEAAERLASAQKDIENLKHQALNDIKDQVAALSVDIAATIIRETLDDAKKKELVNKYISEIQSN